MAFESNRTKRRKIQAEVERHIENINDEIFLEQNFSLTTSNNKHPNIPGKETCITETYNDLSNNNQHQGDSDTSEIEDTTTCIEQPEFKVNDSDFDNPIESDEDVEGNEREDLNLKPQLAQWACKFNIPHASLSELLHVLRKYHPHLPKDPRTLLGTQTNIVTKSVSGGEYFHIGIEKGILSALKFEELSVIHGQTVTLQINIDGLPIFKSSNSQFWPILGMLNTFEEKHPFLIGLYHGNKKPTDLNFLNEFVTEYKMITSKGLQFQGNQHLVVISAIICDAPARAMIKNIKGHGGYAGCDKCDQPGVYLNKITFPETNACRRTDDSFKQMLDNRHHHGPTPLSELCIGMVSNFPLDYMHLVCLGVMRRLIKFWVKGPLKTRQGPRIIQDMSACLLEIRNSMPCEFARKPRALTEFERWKATEFRQFLVYTGPVILYKRLPKALYKNFMLLSVAISIYLHPINCYTHRQYAHERMVLFVNHYAQLYGNDMITYNVHGLVHLSEEVERYGPLDNISCFPFENYLGQLKRLVRKPESPLEQVIRRVLEVQSATSICTPSKCTKLFQQQHQAGPVPGEMVVSQQYKVLNLPNFTLKISDGDNCTQIANDIVVARNFFHCKGENYILFEKFCSMKPFFADPLDSTVLGIFKVKHLSGELTAAPISNILKKLVLMPQKHSYVAIPLLHQ